MSREPVSAPAAHMVTVRPGEGGVVVGHLGCSAAAVFVPNRAGQDYCLSIDIIQAVINHQCPPAAVPDTDDPAGWVVA